MVNRPFSSAVTPEFVPLIITEAEGTGSPVEVVTLPVTCRVWLYPENGIRKASNKKIERHFFLMCVNLGLVGNKETKKAVKLNYPLQTETLSRQKITYKYLQTVIFHNRF